MESSESLDFFENQNVNISNEFWNVEISYSKINSANKKNGIEKIIELQNEYQSNSVFICIQKTNSKTYDSLEIKGLDGAIFLYKSTENEKSQTVKLNENNLIMSLGFSLLSLNLNKIELNWIIKPDFHELFGFINLEDDVLLRGESQIHRIDSDGTVKWSFDGRDIWVNLEGKNEMSLEENVIRLFDFESNEYVLNFEGELLEDKPRIVKTKKPTLFSNPKRWWYQKVWEHMTKIENK